MFQFIFWSPITFCVEEGLWVITCVFRFFSKFSKNRQNVFFQNFLKIEIISQLLQKRLKKPLKKRPSKNHYFRFFENFEKKKTFPNYFDFSKILKTSKKPLFSFFSKILKKKRFQINENFGNFFIFSQK